MNGNNPVVWIIVMIVGYSFIAVAAYLFAFRPDRFVRRQAAFYREVYKQGSKMSDEEIDRKVKPFWFLFMIDSMSHFVNKGVEHPEEFPRLILSYRAVGCFLWVVLALVVLLLAWGLITGGLAHAK